MIIKFISINPPLGWGGLWGLFISSPFEGGLIEMGGLRGGLINFIPLKRVAGGGGGTHLRGAA